VLTHTHSQHLPYFAYRFYQHGKQVLEAFNAAGVTLTFAFDRKLGVRELVRVCVFVRWHV
jgi:hypothetical protein